ncbi:MAG: GGDEF domain-containing protein [archaeon]
MELKYELNPKDKFNTLEIVNITTNQKLTFHAKIKLIIKKLKEKYDHCDISIFFFDLALYKIISEVKRISVTTAFFDSSTNKLIFVNESKNRKVLLRDDSYVFDIKLPDAPDKLGILSLSKIQHLQMNTEIRNYTTAATTLLADLLIEEAKDRKLFRESFIDRDTGLFNKAYLDKKWLELKHNKNQRPICLIMIDIDNFKSLNDFGYSFADKVRDEVIFKTKNLVPSDAILIRKHGRGDEFIVLLTKREQKYCIEIAEKVHSSIKNSKIKIGDKEVKITVTIGVTLCPNDVDKISDLEEHADRTMLIGKKMGKDRVVSSSELKKIILPDYKFIDEDVTNRKFMKEIFYKYVEDVGAVIIKNEIITIEINDDKGKDATYKVEKELIAAKDDVKSKRGLEIIKIIGELKEKPIIDNGTMSIIKDVKSGIYYCNILYDRYLSKDLYKYLITSKFLNTFTDSENQWSHKILIPTENLKIMIKLPKTRGCKSYNGVVFRGSQQFSIEKEINFIPNFDELFQCISLTCCPTLYDRYLLKWVW